MFADTFWCGKYRDENAATGHRGPPVGEGETMDTKKRSWAKSITWRVVGIILLGLITYLITRNWKAMTTITVLFHCIRVILYYYHERIWGRISWGKLKHPLAELPVTRNLTPADLELVRDKLRALGYIDPEDA